jgi:hypothetical protein
MPPPEVVPVVVAGSVPVEVDCVVPVAPVPPVPVSSPPHAPIEAAAKNTKPTADKQRVIRIEKALLGGEA